MTIQDEMQGADARSAIAALKTSIANELSAEDPSLGIKTTEYFNNTFAPDMILTWPDQEERQLFLRANIEWAALREDLTWIADRKPIVMPLDEVEAGSEGALQLQNEAAQTSILVSTRPSVAALVRESSPRQLSSLLVSSVLRGGRGYMDRSRAARTVESLDTAYEAAQTADSDPVVRAVDELEALVDVRNSGVLTRFLQAVWIGSGSSASSFPGAIGATGVLDAAGLQLLLDIADAEDEEFWQRLGRSTTLEQLVAVQAGPESETLQALMRHALPSLRAAGMGLAQAGQALDGTAFRWFAQRGYLALQLPAVRAVFTPTSIIKAELGERVSTAAPTFAVVQARADDLDAKLVEIRLETSTGNKVVFTPGTAASLDDDALLQELSDVNQAPTVEQLTLALPSDRRLVCNLSRVEAHSRTRGWFYVSELLRFGLPLLVDLSPEVRRFLEELEDETKNADGSDVIDAAEMRESTSSPVPAAVEDSEQP